MFYSPSLTVAALGTDRPGHLSRAAVMRGRQRAFMALGALALAGGILLPPIRVERRATDVIAVVDITQSMNVTDGVADGRAVSRLSEVKSALIEAVARLPCGSRLGLGVFTQYRTVILLMPVETCGHRQDLEDTIAGVNGTMAWLGGSEIAKGLYLTLRMLKSLDDPPSLAFFTDGHEAPPINPRYRINLGDEAGKVRGSLIGVGQSTPRPIPRVDPEGQPAGVWGPNDVLQEDLYARGRQGSVQGEPMAQTEPATAAPVALQGTPGTEHLSALREPYLEFISGEAMLPYVRLENGTQLIDILTAERHTVSRTSLLDVRWVGAILALLTLVVPYILRIMRMADSGRWHWPAADCDAFSDGADSPHYAGAHSRTLALHGRIPLGSLEAA